MKQNEYVGQFTGWSAIAFRGRSIRMSSEFVV
jgi:hypothetical protein